MESATVVRRACWGLALLLVATPPAWGGILNGDPSSLPGWTGTTPYANPAITGTVDFAVYHGVGGGPGQFPYAGYVPLNPNDFIYAYQIFVDPTSPDPVSAMTVLTANPYGNVSSFLLPPGGAIVPTNAGANILGPNWTFISVPNGNGSIPPNGASIGLVYESPNPPTLTGGALVDGGTTAYSIPLPSPANSNIPEPSTIVLLLGALVFGIPGVSRKLWRRANQ